MRTENWPNPADIALFRRATSRLEKLSRKGLLKYKILRFEKPTPSDPIKRKSLLSELGCLPLRDVRESDRYEP